MLVSEENWVEDEWGRGDEWKYVEREWEKARGRDRGGEGRGLDITGLAIVLGSGSQWCHAGEGLSWGSEWTFYFSISISLTVITLLSCKFFFFYQNDQLSFTRYFWTINVLKRYLCCLLYFFKLTGDGSIHSSLWISVKGYKMSMHVCVFACVYVCTWQSCVSLLG